MENIRTGWLNFVFLLIMQLHECPSSASSINATLSMSYTTNSMTTIMTTTNSTTMGNSSILSRSLNATSNKITVTVNSNNIKTTMPSISPKKSSSSVTASSSVVPGTSGASEVVTMNTTPGSLSTTTNGLTATSGKTSSDFITSSSVVSGTSGDSDDGSEPKTELYVWQLVAIGCGAFVLILFIIIGLLCYQNRALKKKLDASRSYSFPIKENGAWIDNQDIPLWQKRASAFVNETPAEENPPTLTT